jgi:hypothetical protein
VQCCSQLSPPHRVLAGLCECQQSVDSRLQQVSSAHQQQLDHTKEGTDHRQNDGGNNLQPARSSEGDRTRLKQQQQQQQQQQVSSGGGSGGSGGGFL